MISFFFLILIGCVLETNSIDNHPLPIEQEIPDSFDALAEENGIPLLANVQFHLMRKFELRQTQIREFAEKVRNLLNQLRCSARYTVEDRLITNLIIARISLINRNIQAQLQNGPLPIRRSFANLETLGQFYQRLNNYVRSMLRQYAQIETSENPTAIQIMGNDNSQNLIFRSDQEIILEGRMRLQVLTSRVHEAYKELEKIKERDALEVKNTNVFIRKIVRALESARIQIQNGPLPTQRRLKIISEINFLYQALDFQIQSMYRMYEQKMFDSLLKELWEFVNKVINLYEQLHDMEERTESELQKADELVDKLNTELPYAINQAKNSTLSYQERLNYIEIIQEYFLRLNGHVQVALNNYGRQESENSEQVCPAYQSGGRSNSNGGCRNFERE